MQQLRTGLIAFAIAAALPGAALAEPDSPGEVIRLSPEDSERAIEEGAARRALMRVDETGRKIHGEVGVMVGTGGTRGIYGTAQVPLGDNAGAAVSFSHFQSREIPLHYDYADPYGYGYRDRFGRTPLNGPVFP